MHITRRVIVEGEILVDIDVAETILFKRGDEMKKKILMILFSCMMGLMLVACGSNTEDNGTEESIEVTEVATEETTELTEDVVQEFVTGTCQNMTFEYPADATYSEEDGLVNITLDEATLLIQVMDFSTDADSAETYRGIALISLMSPYDDISNEQEMNTTIGGQDANGATGIVNVSGNYLSMMWLTVADPNGECIYAITFGATSDASDSEHDAMQNFLDSVEFI